MWQVPQSPEEGWLGSFAGVGRVTIVTPKKLFPVSWQVAHAAPATGAWFIGVLGPNAVKFVAAWQASQAAPAAGT